MLFVFIHTCLYSVACIMQSVLCPALCKLRYPLPSCQTPSTANTITHSLILPLPILDPAQNPLQRWKQTPRLHSPTQHTKAHQQHPRQRQNNSKRDPVSLDRIRHSQISRHVFSQKGQRQEQDGCFADE